MFRWILICLTLMSMLGFSSVAQAIAELPGASTKPLPVAKEDSVSTFVPSEASQGRGLAVNIIYPEKPRYEDGAPVAVVVPGGETASGLNFCMHAAQSGFVEIRFAFPGGGVKGFASEGKRSYRGELDQIALRDVILFAMGKLEDYKERSIKDLVPIKVSADNVGVVGWSNGGNIALITLNKYADELKAVAWLAFYESPIGAIFYPPSLGSTQDLLLNSHYRIGSGATGRCLIDFRKLAYDGVARRNPGVGKKLGIRESPGVIYFDENGNKHWDEETEFAFNYLSVGNETQFYPPEVTSAMDRMKVFKNCGWPAQIANLDQADKFYQERDGSLTIPAVCSKFPNLLVSVFGSHLDHLQRQPDHPHILLQYALWLDNGAHWVRVNPEPIYVQSIANMNMRTFAHNAPNAPLESDDVNSLLEPEGILKDITYMQATIAELADRTKTKNLASPLDAPLVLYSNGAPMPVPTLKQVKDNFGSVPGTK